MKLGNDDDKWEARPPTHAKLLAVTLAKLWFCFLSSLAVFTVPYAYGMPAAASACSMTMSGVLDIGQGQVLVNEMCASLSG